MSNVRVDNSAGRTQAATSTETVGNVATTTSSASTETPQKADQTSSDSKSAGAFKQRGSEVKSQQNITAKLIKHDLEKHIGNLPTKTITVEKDAGNDKLAKIHVQREVNTTPPKQKMLKEYVGHMKEPELVPGPIEPGNETSKTRFPNGVGFQTDSAIEPDGKHDLRSVSIEPPPGGKVENKPDGGSVIYDKDGHKVGELQVQIGDDGVKATLVVHSKEGEYVQSGDGQIKFTPKAQGK